MNTLYLVRAPIAMDRLARWAAQRGWIRHVRHGSGFDEGRALHHLIDETFGPGKLRPFRLQASRGRAAGSLYGYCANDAGFLRDAARVYGPPEHLSVLDMDGLRSKAMPAAWTEGRRIGFDVRVRPVRRLQSALDNGGRTFRKGAELDAFLIEALRRYPDDTQGMIADARNRETVYLDWLAEQLGAGAKLDRRATRLARFRRTRISRGTAGPEGPDATFHGTLNVTHTEAFSALLRRGVGRHRGYGYGMLFVRPPRAGHRGDGV